MTEQLRLADGPSTSVQRVINASPETLWALITDINLPARYSTEFKGAEWLNGATEAAVGAQFAGTNEHPVVGAWQTESTITMCDAPTCLEWTVKGGGGPAAVWKFTIEATDGGTLVTQHCQIGPGRSGINPAIEKMPEREHDIITYRLREHAANMERNLDGLESLI
jgi:uncharacterized protein YndB with AHSA1/START domain